MNSGQVRVLLIDDDEDDYVYLIDLFEEIHRHKYQVTWKSSYAEGLKALLNQQFDICLLDYRLGERTGIDLLKEARQLGATSCPIIFLTGHGDLDLDIQAMQTGASEYLVKGQLTALLLERTVRYSMKHAQNMQELKDSKAQILQQDRLASLGLLASSLAHEIGTPLGIIRSRAELVEKKAATNESVKQDMGTVITQIDRITKLVNSLLNLAREKKSDLAGAVDLNHVVQDILNLIRHELDRKGIQLDVLIPSGVFVMAEAGPLAQVLLNLLVNSVHAIEEAKKNERPDRHQIILHVTQLSDAVEILIQDTGCGIPEKNISQLFKPFFTTKDIGQGTGLGLATSYKIVQSWNGSITAESRDGLGAIFRIKLLKAS